MSLSTQLGLPASARRAVWASAAGIATFALACGSKKKKIFDAAMIGAFVIGFATCIPLSVPSPEAQGGNSTT